MLLITRTLEPQKLYKEVEWGLLVFFVGLFLIVGAAENAGITGRLLDFARHWNLQRMGIFTLAVPGLCNVVNNVPAVMLMKSLVPGFANPHSTWLVLAMASTLAGKPYDYRECREHHRGRNRTALGGDRVSGLSEGRSANRCDHAAGRVGVAGMDGLIGGRGCEL